MLDSKPSWCAVMTHSGAEATVARHFDNDINPIEYYLPMMVNRDRRYKRNPMEERPMFPGYIFVHINNKQIYQTRSTRGVIYIVSSQHSIVTMRDSEIEAIRRFEATQRKFNLRETTKLVKGARAKILSGEFAGLEGVLVKDNKDGNFAVNIEVMNTSFVVHVMRSELKAADEKTENDDSRLMKIK